MRFAAQRWSTCKLCGLAIQPGQVISSVGHDMFAHVNCPDAPATTSHIKPGTLATSGTGEVIGRWDGRAWQPTDDDGADALQACQQRRWDDGLAPLPEPSEDDPIASPEFARAYVEEALRLVDKAKGPLARALLESKGWREGW